MLYRSLCITFALFLACCFTFPAKTEGYHHHQNNNGLETLLTAGVLAKVLQKKGGGHHHHQPIYIPIPVPVHHEEHHHKGHHHHHGAHSMPMMAYGGPPMPIGRHAMPFGAEQPFAQEAPFGHGFEPTSSVQVINIGKN